MDRFLGTPPNEAEFEVHRLIGFGVPAEAAFPLIPLFGQSTVIRPFVDEEQEASDE